MAKFSMLDQVMSLVRRPASSGRTYQPPPLSREDKVKNAFERAPIGIAYVSSDGQWLQVNLKFRQLVGYTREQLTRIAFPDLTHPDDAREEGTQLKRLVAGDIDHFRLRKRIMERKGTYRSIELTTSLLRTVSGEPDIFVYILDDPEAPVVDATVEADRHLVSVVDQLDSVAVIRSNDRGVIIGWNAGATRIFGFTAAETLGKSRRMLYRDADVWEDKPGEQLRRVAENGRIDLEDWRVGKNGTHYWVATTIMAQMRDGLARSYVEIITDVSSSKAPTGDVKKTIDTLRDEIAQHVRSQESLRHSMDDARVLSEETGKELRIMAVALRKEMDRRKNLEEELRLTRGRIAELSTIPVVAQVPPNDPEPQEVEAVITAEAADRTWRSLAGVSPAELLVKHGEAEASGTLILVNGDRQKEIFFDKGKIYSCASNDPSRFLTQRLIALGFISEDQRIKALEIQKETHLALGRILVILGLISEGSLLEVMRRKTEEEVVEVFDWREARYAFIEGGIPTHQLVPLRIEVAPLIVQRLSALSTLPTAQGPATVSDVASRIPTALIDSTDTLAPAIEPVDRVPARDLRRHSDDSRGAADAAAGLVAEEEREGSHELPAVASGFGQHEILPAVASLMISAQGREGSERSFHSPFKQPQLGTGRSSRRAAATHLRDVTLDRIADQVDPASPDGDSAASLVASSAGKSRKYHLANCNSVRRLAPGTKIHFTSEDVAKKAGYTRCGNCFRQL